HKVLAVCEEPFGAHPQPVFASPEFGVSDYADDFEHYELWREMCHNEVLFSRFERVLAAEDSRKAYWDFAEPARLDALHAHKPPRRTSTPFFVSAVPDRTQSGRLLGPTSDPHSRPNEILLVLAARTIARRVKARGYKTVLASVGHPFLAAR